MKDRGAKSWVYGLKGYGCQIAIKKPLQKGFYFFQIKNSSDILNCWRLGGDKMQTDFKKNWTVKLLKLKIEEIRSELYQLVSQNRNFYDEDIQEKSQELDYLMNKLMKISKESTC